MCEKTNYLMSPIDEEANQLAVVEQTFEALAEDLRAAHAHTHLFLKLRKAIEEHQATMKGAPCFWSFTIQAHLQASVLSLCRLYDRNPNGLTLFNLLSTIKELRELLTKEKYFERNRENVWKLGLIDNIRQPSLEQLQFDLDQCNPEKNSSVRTLKIWRDKAIMHKDADSSKWTLSNPMAYETLDGLQAMGFDTLNRYANQLYGVQYEPVPSKRLDDYLGVFASIIKQ